MLAPAAELRLMQQREQLVVYLLALADDEEVDKRRHRLRVRCRGTTGHDYRQQVWPVRASERDAAHVQHVEHRRERHLVAYRESDRVELAQRIAAFQRVERDVRLLHLLVHVAPRRVNALTPDIVEAVHGVIQDAHAEVRHAYLIGVRKAEREPDVDLRLVLDYLIIFAAGVARGLLHARQYAFKSFVHFKLRRN